MKKIFLTIAFSLVIGITFAQTNNNSERLKYVTNGPDGKVAITIYDDIRENSIKLESVNAFYKYQILDTETSEPIYSANNKGKECTIDKSKIAAGNYNIRLYTLSFVITSKLTISATRKLNTMIKNGSIAMND
jgi:hypothetical protein